MSLNIITTNVPAHLKITQTMIEDFIMDPVLGAKVIMNLNLDAFQRVRLKVCWWTPRVIDSSGFSSAKTINMWIVSNLRAMLLGYTCGVYYPAFESGKKVYEPYFTKVAAQAPIYRAQMGKPRVIGVDGKTAGDEKAMKKGPSCLEVSYKGGGKILMPAPNFLQDAKGQAGQRFNDLYVDEWTKIESTGSEGIDQQLIGRTTLLGWNQDHPIFGNHHLFLATAEDTSHRAYDRYSGFVNEVKDGDPEYALLNFSFKDYSDAEASPGKTFKEAHRIERTIKDMRRNKTRSGFLQEALGIWSKSGAGWYTGEMLERCIELGRQRKTTIYQNRAEDPQGEKAFYFLGVDPAPGQHRKADDGALVMLRAVPLTDTLVSDAGAYDLSFCWAMRLRGVDAPFWSGIIHKKHRDFGLTGIMMDGGGGGNWIHPELRKSEQTINRVKTTVRPIACIEDEQNSMVMGDFILCMFRPKDALITKTWEHMPMLKWENVIDVAHQEFREGLSNGIAIPVKESERPRGEIDLWPAEKQWALNLLTHRRHGLASQLLGIYVVVDDAGKTFFTKGSNARKFESRAKKDFAYAAMMAYVRFLIWVRGGVNELSSVPEEDADMCWGN